MLGGHAEIPPIIDSCGPRGSSELASAADETACGVGDSEVATRAPTTKSKSSNSKDAEDNETDTAFADLLKVWTKDMQEEAKHQNAEILKLVTAMGGNAREFQREDASRSKPSLRDTLLRF